MGAGNGAALSIGVRTRDCSPLCAIDQSTKDKILQAYKFPSSFVNLGNAAAAPLHRIEA